jgi:myo-inositol-1(or 4)-monophosphatase
MIRTPIMNVMSAAALKAGRSLRRDFAELPSLTISRKGPGDFVSEADKRAEKILFEELSKGRPGYGFLMEEGGVVEGSDKTHRFIIDPLDGTTNFLHAIPHFAISIGLEREGEIVAGLVYNPVSEEMFVAEKGMGAFVQGATNRDNYRLRVSPRVELIESLIGCGIPFAKHGDGAQFITQAAGVIPRVAGLRRMGAAALDLAFVAAGRFEGFWEHALSPWDMAAGIILIKESGGFLSDGEGGNEMLKKGSIIAGNEPIFNALSALLRPAPGALAAR